MLYWKKYIEEQRCTRITLLKACGDLEPAALLVFVCLHCACGVAMEVLDELQHLWRESHVAKKLPSKRPVK